MKEIDNLIKYIRKKYEAQETENINHHKNVMRYTKPIMSGYVENAIAVFIDDILKDKNLFYLIDSQLAVGKGKVLRPDIIIYDQNNVIHAIIEVKSQLGYSGGFKKTSYDEKIKKIKTAAKKRVLYAKKMDSYFSVSDDCLDFVVIFMATNHIKNLKRFEKVTYFALYENSIEKIWYDKITKELLNHNEHGIEKFIEYINKIGDNND